jgi:hypothetical protein
MRGGQLDPGRADTSVANPRSGTAHRSQVDDEWPITTSYMQVRPKKSKNLIQLYVRPFLKDRARCRECRAIWQLRINLELWGLKRGYTYKDRVTVLHSL